jgi:NAD(P)-dependent dehydrogenase (short-subunit alcohol dehydrogenase family)
MKRQGQGWIVNLGSSSVTSYGHEGERGLALYGALKAAVHRFTTGFAFELKEHNIAVNVVTPVTMILTGGTESLGLNSPEMQPHHERVEHIAEATLALVSKAPQEQTGVIAWSHQYLDEIGRSTMSLDGKTVVQQRGK